MLVTSQASPGYDYHKGKRKQTREQEKDRQPKILRHFIDHSTMNQFLLLQNFVPKTLSKLQESMIVRKNNHKDMGLTFGPPLTKWPRSREHDSTTHRNCSRPGSKSSHLSMSECYLACSVIMRAWERRLTTSTKCQITSTIAWCNRFNLPTNFSHTRTPLRMFPMTRTW